MDTPILASRVVVEWPNWVPMAGNYDVTTHQGALRWLVSDGVLLVEEFPKGSTRDQVNDSEYLPAQTFAYPTTSIRRFRTEPSHPPVAPLKPVK